MEDTIIVEVHSTKDYDTFKHMIGNRRIDWNHVNRLRQEMDANPDWFKKKPINVNKHMFIIDGQNRLEAARLGNHPVYYIIDDDMNLSTARRMNQHQKPWTNHDWARSWADGGNMNYVWLLRIADQYKNLSLSNVMVIMSDESSFDTSRYLKEGKFTINDIDDATERVKLLSEIKKTSGQSLTSSFCHAFKGLLAQNEFDIGRFMKKLRDKPDLLMVRQSKRDNLRAIEDVYNFHSPTPTRLY